MRLFSFFVKKIFLRKMMVLVGVSLLLFISNYLIFVAARSTIATVQGYEEFKTINKPDNFVANLDPDSHIDLGRIEKQDTQKVYDYMKQQKLQYAWFVDGYIADIPNYYNMEVSFAYLNENYYQLNQQFHAAKGEDLSFDYPMEKQDIEIPVLVGSGLSKDYPIGSVIKVIDPMLEKEVSYRVKGLLEKNTYHSNMYSLSSKQYYNFSVVVPVNAAFLERAGVTLHIQGLMDVIVLDTTREQAEKLNQVMLNELGLKYNFYSQEENTKYFNEYYYNSTKVIIILTIIMSILIVALAVWSSLANVRLMLKDFTINLFVGLSYGKLRKILYEFYTILFGINILMLFAIAAYSRYGAWLRKDASFSTFGLLGIVSMDWLSLGIAVVFNIFISVVIVEIMMYRIKKVPISLGVLQ